MRRTAPKLPGQAFRMMARKPTRRMNGSITNAPAT
jgi:hypothetical protein